MHEVQPDLVLMDLYMPDASGIELTAIIRDHGEFFDTPIIFLSAETDPDKQLEALRVGGDSFIAKPIQREQLIGAIEHRIRMSRLLKDRRVNGERQRCRPRRAFQGCVSARSRSPGARGGDRTAPGVGLVLIELDRFKTSPAHSGSTASSGCCASSGRSSPTSSPREESAARLDDFTFAVLARRDTREALEGFGEQLLRLFGATKLRAGTSAFRSPRRSASGSSRPPRTTPSRWSRAAEPRWRGPGRRAAIGCGSGLR
jgi:hypothetical protein